MEQCLSVAREAEERRKIGAEDAHVVNNMAQPGQVWCFFYNQCAPNATTTRCAPRWRR